MDPKFRTCVEISRSTLEQNLTSFRRQIGSTALMSVVKSNAYGHGLGDVASIADPLVDAFGVDSIDEALMLREQGITKMILVMGYIPFGRLIEAIESDISFSLCSDEMLQFLVDNPTKKKARVHLELETGLSRQGIVLEHLQRFTTQASSLAHVEIEGIFTHFANVEELKSSSYSEQQVKTFKEGIEVMRGLGIEPKYIHAACSAAIVLEKEALFTLVRLGIGQYGLWSSDDMREEAEGLSLDPVLSWKTRVAQVKMISSGSSIGYGMTVKVKRETKLAVIPVGYWDGFDRVGNSNGSVLIGGQRCPILGRICMNMCMVDVTDVDQEVHVGDEVMLIGKQGNELISADELAERSKTIHYEIVTRINPLIPRLVV